ncbi:hypothetical protein [Clostridium coskatii]|uniref:Uncharacterized protein n=1 Tax=Clostridium coskatii TaxID=1705578 RepID=A0A170NL26_9CLOT|nr:hypothetical protein [Clostridium coskatii]OAA91313.1 hypothetical protein WX73_01723 [Clostridium coskatii]OBR93945.1 hypothetical protein CLCOS_20810 [Clostridium coskatii]
MANRKERKIKVVVMNPERIPYMEQKITKLLYEEYIREISTEDYERIED